MSLRYIVYIRERERAVESVFVDFDFVHIDVLLDICFTLY